jgi:hypothetical protein
MQVEWSVVRSIVTGELEWELKLSSCPRITSSCPRVLIGKDRAWTLGEETGSWTVASTSGTECEGAVEYYTTTGTGRYEREGG